MLGSKEAVCGENMSNSSQYPSLLATVNIILPIKFYLHQTSDGRKESLWEPSLNVERGNKVLRVAYFDFFNLKIGFLFL